MRKHDRQRGAAIVEFAFLVPIVVLLAFGVIDYGRMASAKINLNEAVQEGSIHAAMHPEFANHDDIEARVIQSIDSPTLTTADVTVSCPSARTIKVTVSYTEDFITPIIPGNLTLNSEVTADVLTPSADCTTS